jgi:hypothetical protein
MVIQEIIVKMLQILVWARMDKHRILDAVLIWLTEQNRVSAAPLLIHLTPKAHYE